MLNAKQVGFFFNINEIKAIKFGEYYLQIRNSKGTE